MTKGTATSTDDDTRTTLYMGSVEKVTAFEQPL